MTEKAAEIKRGTPLPRWGKQIRENGVWVLAGFALELGASEFSAAPAAAALVAGLSKKRALFALAGGIFGALLHGFPNAFIGLAALAIVMAAKLVPDIGNAKIRAALRFLSAAGACFFSKAAEVSMTSELLMILLASFSSGIFALCLSLLESAGETRGTDITEPRDNALIGMICALSFMSFGALDYTYINIGRLVLGTALLFITSQRGLAWFAVIGLPALFGLCAADPVMGAGAAAMTFAAAASCVFTRFGKLPRAAGYVFFTALGALITGVDEGSWRLITETVVSGAAFVFIPARRVKDHENDFSDAAIALMIRERLNFAADALAGIGSGINAAAETLDRKYTLSIDRLGERAAERVCRSCPNSMSCWGKNYDLFSAEFSRLIQQLRTGFELTEFSMSPECSEICVNQSAVIKALGAEYSRYISAMADERRIRELRRIYTDQLGGVQEILRSMSRAGTGIKSFSRSRAAEKRAEKVLAENGVEFPQAFITFDKSGRMSFEAYGSTEPRVEREYLGTLLIKALGRELELPEISGGCGRYRITAAEVSALSAKIGAFQLPRGQNNVCGDCYDSFTDAAGALYIILSDGMGTGSRARVDSAMACSVLSKLIKGGIPLPAALETVNTVLLVKSADESFATLDICRIDLNSGECAVYKAGAATTYIKTSDKLLRASLSSPPAGTGGRLTVPAQRFRVRAGDVIIMTTDGAVLDEQWLSRELSEPSEPKELSERIAKAARAAENGKNDDISVIAVAVSS